jgi:excisionase family DNA binding protein
MSITSEINHNTWLTVEQAAQYLACSASFLHKDRLTKLHGIPFSRLGRAIRYSRQALDDYMQRCAVND